MPTKENKIRQEFAGEVIERLIRMEMANLSVKDLEFDNPLLKWTRADLENPGLAAFRLLRNPDYCYFACKHLLNVKLLPFQQTIIREMWYRPFPMLIASRGASKSWLLAVYALLRCLFIQGRKVVIMGAGFRQSKIIMQYAESIWYNSPILRSIVQENPRSGPHHDADRWELRLGDSTILACPVGDGCLSLYTLITYGDRFGYLYDNSFGIITKTDRLEVWGNGRFRDSDETYRNGLRPVKIVKTRKGFCFTGTSNHRMRVCRNNLVDFVRTDEMIVGDHILIDRSYRWHDGFTEITEDEAYAAGLLVGDGCWTHRYRVGFASQDKESSDSVERLFSSQGWQLRRHGENDPYHCTVTSMKARQWFIDYFGIVGHKTITKEFPKEILKSTREVTSSFISGLFDADGHIQASTFKGDRGIVIGFTNTSERLVDQLQYILLHYGIISYKTSRDRNDKWNRVYELLITGPNVKKFHDSIGFRLKRKADMLASALAAKTRDYANGDSLPNVHAQMLAIARKYRIRKGKGNNKTTQVSGSKIQNLKSVSHNIAYTFCEVYEPIVELDSEREFITRLRNLANPDIFYDKIVSIEDGECETFDIHVPDGNEYCANGFFSHNSKIRGYRAHDILTDEFACLRHNTLVETDLGIMRINDSFNESTSFRLLGRGYELPIKFIKTPPTNVYRITTEGNYEFYCSGIHQVRGINAWKLAKDLQPGDRLEFSNAYKFPERYITCEDITVDENLGWLMGILTSEGSINNRHSMSVNMTDKDCIDRVDNSFKIIDKNIHITRCHKECYEDIRGEKAKETWVVSVCNLRLRDILVKLGLERCKAADKRIPWSILRSPRSVVIAFLEGLWEGNGSAFHWKDRKINNKLGMAYCSVSEELCREVQFLLYKFNLFSTCQDRLSKLNGNKQWMIRLNGQHALNLAKMLDIEKHKILIHSCYIPRSEENRGLIYDKFHDKWNAYATIHGERKFLKRCHDKEEALELIRKAQTHNFPSLRVKSVVKLPDKESLYDYYLPKSHSFYGNGFLQHNSVPRDIYETVIAGFGVVELEPYDKVKRAAEIAVYKRLGVWTDEMTEAERFSRVGNQSIVSGTAYYQFNHFAEYWKRWKGIIYSKGDPEKIKQVIGDYPEPGFDWRDYMIIRLPVNLLPPGYMDARHVARSKATVHSGVFLNEFSAVFSADTYGFFKRTLIEGCVTNKPILIGNELVQFRCLTKGNLNLRYVYGVDPASEEDKFSIVILEMHETHRRIVYCWTFDKKEHTKRIQEGLTTEKDFYAFCARKIRDLMKVFPCEHIALDSQGGGVAIREALHDDGKMEKGEIPIWEIRADHIMSDTKVKPTDDYPGLHILELVNLVRIDYTVEANHGLRKDFEDKLCLFPVSQDTATLAIAWEADTLAGRTVDTYEECFMEIEELKEELATIIHTQSPGSNRDRWTTPEVKLPGSKKGRLRKDRYSALLMANMAARTLQRKPVKVPYENFGGFVGQIKTPRGGPNYISGPDWFVNPANQNTESYGRVIRRGT